MASNKEIGIQKIIEVLDQDIKLNGDQPITTTKLKRVLEVVYDDITKE
jgi:hypothetical protein|tara:strand:- start:114 stop:257 length:144 start_codon:yes stop_codon:yes gene_type:complete